MEDKVEPKVAARDGILYVSFYTRNTPYEQEVKGLVESLERFQLPYHVEGLESQGDWYKNARMKPRFIRDALERFHEYRAIVWLDADSVIVRHPALFYELEDVDFAMHWRGARRSLGNILKYGTKFPNRKNRTRLIEVLRDTRQWRKPFACVIYLRNSPMVRRLVDEWIATVDAEPGLTGDQINLERSLARNGHYSGETRLLNLPSTYAEKFDEPSTETVIRQNQATRRFRPSNGVVGKG